MKKIKHIAVAFVALMVIGSGALLGAAQKTPFESLIETIQKGDVLATEKVITDNAPNLKTATPYIPPYINLRDSSGFTPLLWAVKKGKTPMVKLLLTYGADINLPGDNPGTDAIDDGPTPLTLAIKDGNQSMVNFLLNNGAQPNKKAENFSPLLWVLKLNQRNSKEKIIGMLIDAGANPFDLNAQEQQAILTLDQEGRDLKSRFNGLEERLKKSRELEPKDYALLFPKVIWNDLEDILLIPNFEYTVLLLDPFYKGTKGVIDKEIRKILAYNYYQAQKQYNKIPSIPVTSSNLARHLKSVVKKEKPIPPTGTRKQF